MADIFGNAQGVDDVLGGTRGNDLIVGYSGDDLLNGARGNDTLIGGAGSDVMYGGLNTDTFVFSAGHLLSGAVDYICDFALIDGDSLSFLDSGDGQVFEVLSIVRTMLTETDFNGHNLNNNVGTGTDIVFTVRNSGTGAEQEIALLDVWSASNNSAWVDYLDSLGLAFT